MGRNVAMAYSAAKTIYGDSAEKILHELILDELGDDYYQQLRYEAACLSLKELKKKIDAMREGKNKRNYLHFYHDKKQFLQSKAAQYDSSPYTF